MTACPACEVEIPPGSRWCAICHVNVVNQQIGRLAPPVKRLLAIALDLLLPLSAMGIAFGGLALLGGRAASDGNTLLAVIAFIIQIAFLAYVVWAFILFTKGTSPGKKLLGMRVIKEDGRNADFFTMLIRETVGRAISSLVFSLGLLWILIDKDNQAWHDKLMRTYVVEAVK